MELKHNMSNGSAPGPQPRLHRPMFYVEAYCMMQYVCERQHAIRVWNSRDGVTPFAIICPLCGAESRHANFRADIFSPGYQLQPGDYYFRDGTLDEMRDAIRARVKVHPPGPDALSRAGARTMEEYIETLAQQQHAYHRGWARLDQKPIDRHHHHHPHNPEEAAE